jgi:hypothetical protein
MLKFDIYYVVFFTAQLKYFFVDLSRRIFVFYTLGESIIWTSKILPFFLHSLYIRIIYVVDF